MKSKKNLFNTMQVAIGTKDEAIGFNRSGHLVRCDGKTVKPIKLHEAADWHARIDREDLDEESEPAARAKYLRMLATALGPKVVKLKV